MDVLSTELFFGMVSWYSNDGIGMIGSQQIVSDQAPGATSVFAADMDGDGDLDVLSAQTLGFIAWYENLRGEVGIVEAGDARMLSFHPNPTTGFITTDLGEPAVVSVLDATGRLVLLQPIANASGPVTVDLSGHENGLYLVQVLFMDGTRAVERVVKE